MLSYPDYSRRFILDTDASDVGIGAVLSQVREDGSEGVVAYASRSLSRPERRYCVTRKELLAVVEFVHHFQQYLLGRVHPQDRPRFTSMGAQFQGARGSACPLVGETYMCDVLHTKIGCPEEESRIANHPSRISSTSCLCGYNGPTPRNGRGK